MPIITRDIPIYGYKLVQNPHNQRMTIFNGAIDANILKEVVSVENAVGWDRASNSWKVGGRNRAISEDHWRSIVEFLSSDNNERILPSPIIISINENAVSFEPFPGMPEQNSVQPGIITLKALYNVDDEGNETAVAESNRLGWVLDGQHRIKAFRHLNLPEPYPINVVILKKWIGDDYEDVMRHQTYELNMGRPLHSDFKAAIREQFIHQIGHPEYREEIALSWIRKDLERRSGDNGVFSADGVIGATNYRPQFIITMTTLENIIKMAFKIEPFLYEQYNLDSINHTEIARIGQFLFDFYQGVKLSLGLINPIFKTAITDNPIINNIDNYWDLAKIRRYKEQQRIIHNVGLKAITRGLMHKVMREDPIPQNPQDVALKLRHLKGIPWHSPAFLSMKDDWVSVIANALALRYDARRHDRHYVLELQKRDANGRPLTPTAINIECFEF